MIFSKKEKFERIKNLENYHKKNVIKNFRIKSRPALLSLIIEYKK